ncbi:4Fe-4S binding protein [Lysinibacillus sphaericus]|nr:4Fe-4S binding protein [Lysinibacillus sphaericus]
MIEQLCFECGACVVVCPVEAIYHEDEDKQAKLLTENHFR